MLGRQNRNDSGATTSSLGRYSLIVLVVCLYKLAGLEFESVKFFSFLPASKTEGIQHADYNVNGTRREQPVKLSLDGHGNFRSSNVSQNVGQATIRVRENDEVNKGENILNISAQEDLDRRRNIGLERLRSKASYIPLPPPDTTNSSNAISVGACCGIGHRLCYNIPTFVYAIQHSRLVYSRWTDISWSVLFNDTDNIKASSGAIEREHYDNDYPISWSNDIPEYPKGVMPKKGTAYDSYADRFIDLFDMPLGHSLIRSLHENLSPSVLSFLTNIREQSYMSELHLCVHIREGNNETGDWAEKEWRHVDLVSILNATLYSMELLAHKNNARNVSVFVASDNPHSRLWLHDRVPSSWNVIEPEKKVAKPESGVWFGQHGSTTNQHLTQHEKDEAMAEAVSDIFALGECDALFIPNYSSFTLMSIMMMRAEKRKVLFMHRSEYEYVELLYPNISLSQHSTDDDLSSKQKHISGASASITDLDQRRKNGWERLRAKASFIPIPPPNTNNSSNAISVGACCGIGHRLCYNIPTFVYAFQHSRLVYSH